MADEQGQVLAMFDHRGDLDTLYSHKFVLTHTFSNLLPSQPLVKEMEKAAQRLVQTIGHVGK